MVRAIHGMIDQLKRTARIDFIDPRLNFQYEQGGTTAITVLLKDKKIYCVCTWPHPHPISCLSSRGMLGTREQWPQWVESYKNSLTTTSQLGLVCLLVISLKTLSIIVLSDEERRIYAAGGWVELNRVNGRTEQNWLSISMATHM